MTRNLTQRKFFHVSAPSTANRRNQGFLRFHPFPFLAGLSCYLRQEVAAGELISIKSLHLYILSFTVNLQITQPSTLQTRIVMF